MNVDSLRSSGLGELSHVAMVVRDIEASIARLSALGIAGWGPRMDVRIKHPDSDSGGDVQLRAVFASAGSIAFELVQPIAGASPISAFLAERGEGVEHFGYRVDDIDRAIASARESGMGVEYQLKDDHGSAVAFLSSEGLFGVHLELVRKEPGINLIGLVKT